jgi:hypothetical protein
MNVNAEQALVPLRAMSRPYANVKYAELVQKVSIFDTRISVKSGGDRARAQTTHIWLHVYISPF